jgi:NADH-ubiquinone oxidoreductase chain 5
MTIGLSTNFWADSLFVLPKNEIVVESKFATPTIIKLIPILFSILGAFVAYIIKFVANQFIFALKIGILGNQLYCFLNKHWFFNKVFNDFIVISFLCFGYEVSFKVLDKGAFEILRPYGISYTFRKLGKQISKLQSGFVYHYAFVMLIGLTIFITIIVMWDFLFFLGR